ncbi:unnamed protein product, partial [Ectocarpus sp. 4 AP-2014]
MPWAQNVVPKIRKNATVVKNRMAAAQGDILSESLGGLALLTVTGDAPGCLESLVVEVNMLQTDSIVANARAFKALCLALLRPQEGIKALIPMCAGCGETIRAVRYHC